MKTMRLDKVLAHLGYGSRKEIKKMVKDRIIYVNGALVKDASQHVQPDIDIITVKGEPIDYKEFIYLMLNKPAGVISATEDQDAETVIDLLEHKYQSFHPFPVGRLDKDTEGLLIITNDGKLSHSLLSPKKHVPKTYYAQVAGKVTAEDIKIFSEGVVLEDGYTTLPSHLIILQSDNISEIELTIYEGKYHQVKRMFLAVGKEVLYLKRIKMGKLELDPNLPLGQYRSLEPQELEILKKN